MAHYRGGIGQLLYRTESSAGTSAADWKGVRVESMPDFPSNQRILVPQSNAGHRNPTGAESSIVAEVGRESAITVSHRIRRASAANTTSTLGSFLQSAGWNEAATADTTVDDVAATVDEIDLNSAAGITAGEAIQIANAVGAYVPTLVHTVSTDTINPTISMAEAPANSAAVKMMHTYAPVTSGKYAVPADKTLQLQLLSHADGGSNERGVLATYCALSTLSSIKFGMVGTPIELSSTFHAGDIEDSDVAMAADDFVDSAPFLVVTPDVQYAFGVYASGSPITTLQQCQVQSVEINPGISVVVDKGSGSGGVNDFFGYVLVQTAPTAEIVMTYRANANIDDKVFTVLEDADQVTNGGLYFHAVQPTRNTAVPSFGAWMPHCRLTPGSEPSFDFKADVVTARFSLTGTYGGLGSSTDIDDQTGAPIYLAIGTVAS